MVAEPCKPAIYVQSEFPTAGGAGMLQQQDDGIAAAGGFVVYFNFEIRVYWYIIIK
jgi:hypothetical protein